MGGVELRIGEPEASQQPGRQMCPVLSDVNLWFLDGEP
jgi:hypothetical protein